MKDQDSCVKVYLLHDMATVSNWRNRIILDNLELSSLELADVYDVELTPFLSVFFRQKGHCPVFFLWRMYGEVGRR